MDEITRQQLEIKKLEEHMKTLSKILEEIYSLGFKDGSESSKEFMELMKTLDDQGILKNKKFSGDIWLWMID